MITLPFAAESRRRPAVVNIALLPDISQRARARADRPLREPPHHRGRRRDARSLPDRPRQPHVAGSAGAGGGLRSRRVRGSAAPPTSRTTCARWARAVDLIGVIGHDESRRAAEERAAPAKGIALDRPDHRPRAPHHDQDARRDHAQPAGGAHRLRDPITKSAPAIEEAIASQVDMRARPAQVDPGLGLSEGRGHAARRWRTWWPFAQSNGLPVIVDPKVPHIDYYAGAALVTPNHIEAESATNSRISHQRGCAARVDRAAAAPRRARAC